MKKILYVVAHRFGRSPGQRFRFEQYLNYLSENGFEYEISNFLNERDDKLFYSKGKYLQKLRIMLKSFWMRYKDIRRANKFDIIFIYRDAIMIGSSFFEKRFSKSKAKVIYDFDDAIWFPAVSEANSNLNWLKNPGKIKKIISYADMIFAGNSYLAEYASQYNNNVKIVPTTIDMNYYVKANVNKDDRICIGWTGSFTTMEHFVLSIPFLKQIKQKYGNRVFFRVISDIPVITNEIEIDFIKWNAETEIKDLSRIDIGIMPLPDDKWAKGKCGFKGLQYMALEIPSLMSPVGVNNEIIQDGINGFLPANENDWIEKISLLIDNPELRAKIGKAGRDTVLKRYSYQSLKDVYLEYFKNLINIL